jgi:hypothetical protein
MSNTEPHAEQAIPNWERVRFDPEYLPKDPYTLEEVDAWCRMTGVDKLGRRLIQQTEVTVEQVHIGEDNGAN